MRHRLTFGPNAALELVMAGLEAFLAEELSSKKPRWGSVETLGHLWGYRRQTADLTIHAIDHVSVSVLADRAPSCVTNEPKVSKRKTAIANYMRPELQFLGDFHTHPYSSLSEINKAKGWQFSDQDRDCLMADEDCWHMSNCLPVMLVLAISPLSRVHRSEQQYVRNNVLRFDIAEYRLWLAAYVGHEDAKRGRTVTGPTRVPVEIGRLPTEVWHGPSERIADYDV